MLVLNILARSILVLTAKQHLEPSTESDCNWSMRTVFHLTQCGTCQRIIKDLKLVEKGFTLRDIKLQPIQPDELDSLREQTGSYLSLFSKRAIKYKTMGLKDRQLSEDDLRSLILEDYTFLKRPVIVIGDEVFAGNEQKTLDRVAVQLDQL
jgi:arsenate reductase